VRFFVTGATGSLGVPLVRHLLASGHEVSILSRQENIPGELSGHGIKVYKADILDGDSLKRAFKGHEGVFHLAGYIGYKRFERAIMQSVNVEGTKAVLAACLASGVRRLLHVSTVNAIAASFEKKIFDENAAYNLSKFHLGYSETKKAAEDLVKAETRIDSVIVSPTTTYGAGDMAKKSRSIQVKVAQGKFPFYSNGGVSVAELGEVVKGMLSAYEKGRSGERYILGGENLTIKEVFDLIAKEAGSKPPHIFLPNMLMNVLGSWGDLMEKLGTKGPLNSESAILAQMYHWFDSSKAQRELNYKIVPATVSIHNSVQWMKEKGMLAKNANH
jgi:dihydroflavonol-4-reductase